jgi:flagellar biosynthetic protein FlhB
MASDEFGERTEQPTERRRTQAREQGNIARSTDLTAALLMLTATGALQFLGGSLFETLARFTLAALSAPPQVKFDLDHWLQGNWVLLGLIATAALPILLLMMAGGLVANVVQVGFLWSPDALLPKWERLSPASGLSRIFSLHSVARLGGSLGKLVVLAAVAFSYLRLHLPMIEQLAGLDTPALVMQYGRCLVELAFYLSLSLVGLAIFDYGFQFWKHEQDLRMTKQEIREELKEMEGDPQIRSRRRDAHRKLAEARQLKDVAASDVVITNPTEIAVAIQYDPKRMPAPMVVAKGMGEIAAQIRRIAAANGVPILERKPLARALYRQVRVGGVIPADMYEVFVEILAYVYRVTGRKPPAG